MEKIHGFCEIHEKPNFKWPDSPPWKNNANDVLSNFMNLVPSVIIQVTEINYNIRIDLFTLVLVVKVHLSLQLSFTRSKMLNVY